MIRKIVYSGAFIVAVASGLAVKASAPKTTAEAFYRNPDASHCVDDNSTCNTSGANTCTLSNGKQGYATGCQSILFKP